MCNKPEKFKLRDVPDWRKGVDCTVTALAAITGAPVDDLASLLHQIAAESLDPIPKVPQESYKFKYALEAVRRLGGDGHGYTYEDREFNARPTIAQYQRLCPRKSLQLVQCDEGLGRQGRHHVFAVENMKVVDVDTKGRVEPFVGPLPGYEAFRVARFFFIFKSGETPPDLIAELPPSVLAEAGW